MGAARTFPPGHPRSGVRRRGLHRGARQRWGYVRLPPSYEERFGFVFRGVADDVIGDFGHNLGSAVGYEMDSAQNSADLSGGPVVLARSAHPLFQPVVNVALSPVADMTLKVGDQGAAVFSVGSIAWSEACQRGVTTTTWRRSAGTSSSTSSQSLGERLSREPPNIHRTS